VGTKMTLRLGPDIGNCLLIVDLIKARAALLRHCTIIGTFTFVYGDGNVVDSIVQNFKREWDENIFRRCNLFGEDPKVIKTTTRVTFKECFIKDPMFVNPKKFDYSLKFGSPCRRKATDGEDIGVQFTPGMIKIRTKAFDLRAKKIIKF